MTRTTLDDLRRHDEAIQASGKWGANETIAISHVSQTQLSIARHYGAIRFNGHHFVYNPDDDSLIRDDVLAFVRKLDKAEAKAAKEAAKTQSQDQQTELL